MRHEHKQFNLFLNVSALWFIPGPDGVVSLVTARSFGQPTLDEGSRQEGEKWNLAMNQ